MPTKPRFALAKQKADALLASAKVRKPPIDVEDVAKGLGAIVRYRPYLGADGMCGMLHRRTGQAPIIGVNLSDARQRQRFTIAHEIGHLLLHTDELHVDSHIHLRDKRSTTAESIEEVEANLFAANLLMPRRFLMADLDQREVVDLDATAIELAERYDVSTQAMTLRLARLLKYGL